MNSKTDAEKAAFRAVLAELGERKPDAMDVIWLLVDALGLTFICRHVERAKEVQATTGMRRLDGKMRTLGGVFFQLVRAELGGEEYKRITLTSWERFKRRRDRWDARKARELEEREREESEPCKNTREQTGEALLEKRSSPSSAQAPGSTSAIMKSGAAPGL